MSEIIAKLLRILSCYSKQGTLPKVLKGGGGGGTLMTQCWGHKALFLTNSLKFLKHCGGGGDTAPLLRGPCRNIYFPF